MSPGRVGPTRPAVPGDRWYDVPAGSREAECRMCKAAIFWVRGANGANVAVDCYTVDGAYRPSAVNAAVATDGRGVSHFADCDMRAGGRTSATYTRPTR